MLLCETLDLKIICHQNFKKFILSKRNGSKISKIFPKRNLNLVNPKDIGEAVDIKESWILRRCLGENE